MDDSATILLGSAAAIGLVHTLVGIDHSLPFVLLARSQRWSLKRLWAVTALCGAAHVLSSVVIGTVGIAIGVGVSRLELFEESRGGIGAWLMIGFGLAYASWGLYHSLRGKRHTHSHLHENGTIHAHEHDHVSRHQHVHAGSKRSHLTALGLFIIFVFGPCEALIPLLLVPAYEQHWLVMTVLVAVFGVCTIGTMLVLVTLGHLGLKWRGFAFLDRHMHVIAGLTIAASGLAINLLGI